MIGEEKDVGSHRILLPRREYARRTSSLKRTEGVGGGTTEVVDIDSEWDWRLRSKEEDEIDEREEEEGEVGRRQRRSTGLKVDRRRERVQLRGARRTRGVYKTTKVGLGVGGLDGRWEEEEVELVQRGDRRFLLLMVDEAHDSMLRLFRFHIGSETEGLGGSPPERCSSFLEDGERGAKEEGSCSTDQACSSSSPVSFLDDEGRGDGAEEEGGRR